MPKAASCGSGGRPAASAATWRAVTAESVRPRWPWPKAKRMRPSFGWAPITGSEFGRRRPAAHPFDAAGFGKRREVAAHLGAHGGGAGEIRRRVDRRQFDRPADAQAVVERRGDEAMLGEEDRRRELDRRRRPGGVVAALGLQRDAQARAARTRSRDQTPAATTTRSNCRRDAAGGRTAIASADGSTASTAAVSMAPPIWTRRRRPRRISAGLETVQ